MPVDLTLFETSTSYTRKQSGLPELVRRDGALAATFVNTASPRRKPLTSYADLLAWGEQTGSLGADDAESLGRIAAERLADAEAAFGRMQELLARLGRILGPLAALKAPDPAEVEALNAEIARLSRRLVRDPSGGYRWTWSEREGDSLDRPLWPVVLSAAEILTSAFYHRVRRCAGKDCDLLFVDRTPGTHRKYCSRTRGCGDQAKAHRNYHTVRKPRRDERRRRWYRRVGTSDSDEQGDWDEEDEGDHPE